MSNTTVKGAATQRGALNKTGMALLGVFGSQDQMQALVRFSSGQIKKVAAGSRLNGGRVAAIDSEGLILEKNGHAKRLHLQN